MLQKATVRLPVEIDIEIGGTVMVIRYGEYYDLEKWLDICYRFGLYENYRHPPMTDTTH